MNLSYTRRFFTGVLVAMPRKNNAVDEDSGNNTVWLITNRYTIYYIGIFIKKSNPFVRLYYFLT